MANLEIQIEGANGWASSLPTWRREVHFPLMGMWGKYSKPLTGYHFYLWLFTFTILHFVFFFTKWSVRREFYLLSFHIFYTTCEGLLWFVLNPAYGWGAFREGNIPWYKELWFLGLPSEYWLRFGGAGVLYLLANNDKYGKSFKFSKLQKGVIKIFS
jgi:hypothetical protein